MTTLALMINLTTKMKCSNIWIEKKKTFQKDIPTLLISHCFLNNQPISSCSMVHTTDLKVNQDPITRRYTKIISSFRNQ